MCIRDSHSNNLHLLELPDFTCVLVLCTSFTVLPSFRVPGCIFPPSTRLQRAAAHLLSVHPIVCSDHVPVAGKRGSDGHPGDCEDAQGGQHIANSKCTATSTTAAGEKRQKTGPRSVGNSSQYLGVTKHKRSGRYVAAFQVLQLVGSWWGY